MSSWKFDWGKSVKMRVRTNTRIRRYPGRANVFTRKNLENNPKGWKEKGQF